MNINTIIFDLGGVIIDLNEQATINAFMAISDKSKEQVVSMYQSSDIFKAHEKGLISNDDFRNGLRSLLEVSAIDQEINHAWNAMLGKITMARLDLLTKLRNKYKVCILSNTNDIHEPVFTDILNKVSGKESLSDFVDEVYYSHLLKMRKPDVEIYNKVLELSNTKAENALFLDDKKENLLGAESVGIQTMHITYPDQILELVKYV